MEATAMDSIITAMTKVTGLMTSSWNLMVANPFITFLLAASLVPVGFKIFGMAKRSAKK